jgi:hypothetical protein
MFCATAQTGFFLAMEDIVKCEHLATSLDFKQKYCITEEPIISETEFKVEGGLQNDLITQNQFFNLRFSKTGFEKLKTICERLPQDKLVFVVKGKAIGTYESKNLKPAQLIQISAKADSNDLSWVLENLKKTN